MAQKAPWSDYPFYPNGVRDCPWKNVKNTADWDECWGIFKFQNGDLAIGNFKSGNLEGLNTYRWSDKSFYTGHFKNGKFHGTGNISYPDGSSIRGIWEEGKLVKEIGRVSRKNDISSSNSETLQQSSPNEADKRTESLRILEDQWQDLNRKIELENQRSSEAGRAMDARLARTKQECNSLKSRGLTSERRTEISARLEVPRNSITVTNYDWDGISCNLLVDTAKGVKRYSF